MFYAPNLTDEQIGAVPNSDIAYPFIFKEGIVEQSYIIQVLGEAETVRIVADGKTLLAELCAYRDVLCLPRQSRDSCLDPLIVGSLSRGRDFEPDSRPYNRGISS